MTFIEDCKRIGITLTDDQLRQFHNYYTLLIEWNQKMNLTAITKEAEVYKKHFYDSLTISKDYHFDHQKVVDIGAGAGFPSIPLKIIYPDLDITIIDSLNKRMTFLEVLIKELGLKNVHLICGRAEEVIKDNREKYDVVLARAVARLNILDELCLPYIKKGGYFLALKGKQGLEEVKEANTGIKKLGGVVINTRVFSENDRDDRSNIIIQKIHHTPSNYPRNYAKIKKNPL